jgi:type I restriction-modification system DNA methylase subunit
MSPAGFFVPTTQKTMSVTISKEESINKVSQLVERFEEQKESYKNSDYNETLTRRDFIDPFFKSLGWDIDNEQGYAESYREVIHEDRVKVGSATKAPDYSFRLVGGKRLFFVEAKKPSVIIKDEISSAYQIRRYGWSAKLPISIITDFEEFSIYDCTKKPFPTDKAATARIKYFTYADYINDFDFIWNTFSREKVLKGGLDKFVQSDTNKKGTATVDNDFLESLDRWRTHLATSISLNNKKLNEDEINFAVQQTIDRIIFLRIAEDRSIEPYGNLKDCIKHGNLYQNLFHLFAKADEKYNSGLFDFNKDKISHHLDIDNKVINTIINELYFPASPYEFAYLPVEILGTAYEQFLGKVIRITPAHHAKIEEKPAVRKAGGVYYTPQYIVEYIVKNTVGKLIEGKTPKEVSKIKIVDPACGSGSFLLGAYQCLLDYHKNYYTAGGKVSKGVKGNTLTPEGNLTTAEKKRILINNIYGVDIDINAVEVTKLSLLLKCMEGETQASIATQMKLFHERVLPSLENNIKSGNSLIDTDYYDNEFDFSDEKKIKPFNWQKAFPDVFRQGGFDAVIGNPPYGADYGNEMKHYLSDKYDLPIPIADTFLMFLKRAYTISKPDSLVAYIIPSTWLYMPQYLYFRKKLLNQTELNEIQLFRKPVFESVTVETCTIISTNKLFNKKSNIHFKEIKDEPSQFNFIANNVLQENLASEKEPNLILTNLEDKSLFNKIKDKQIPLKEVALTVCGLTPYRLGKGKPQQNAKVVKERAFDSNIKKDKTYRRYLMGRDFNRYRWQIEKERWISYGDWLAEPRYKAPFNDDRKIIIRQTSDR